MPHLEVYSVDYSTDELMYFEKEMQKYKLPKITKTFKKFGLPFLRRSFLPIILVIAIFMIISNSCDNDLFWNINKGLILFYILGFGLFALTSFLIERYSANRLRRRLGLNQRDFNIMIISFQITGM